MPKKLSARIKADIRTQVAEAHRGGIHLTVRELHRKLEREHGKGSVSATTVFNHMRQANSDVRLDVPEDLPWDPSPLEWQPEAYQHLLDLDRFLHLGREDLTGNDVMDRTPPRYYRRNLTQREAKWGGHLYAALKDAPIKEALFVVSAFAAREFVSEMYQQPIEIADLIAYIAFKPWRSEEAIKTYRLACDLDLVPLVGSIEKEIELPKIDTSLLARVDETFEITANATLTSLEEILAPAESIQEEHMLWEVIQRARLVQEAATKKIIDIQGRELPAFWKSSLPPTEGKASGL